MGRVLHILSQRPLRTGSGVTLEALVRRGRKAGWDQHVLAAAPVHEPISSVGDLEPTQVTTLAFEGKALPFPVPGMSDVMPYPSMRYSKMTAGQLAAYEAAWRRIIVEAARSFRPDVIHSHHIWIVSALTRELLTQTPLVVHCHGTGLRQMALCPALAERARTVATRADRVLALHAAQAAELAAVVGVPPDRIAIVGAGYREDFFHSRGRPPATGAHVVYAGKYSAAKGLPWLLDAIEVLASRREVTLHVAGGATGADADRLRRRMRALAPHVVDHGELDQRDLAELFRCSTLFVLPSLFEGLPLVLCEALACGCRLACTALPGVRDEIAPRAGDLLELVPMPRLAGPDRPVEADQPRFVADLAGAVDRGLDRGAAGPPPAGVLDHFGWDAVFQRVEAEWRAVLEHE